MEQGAGDSEKVPVSSITTFKENYEDVLRRVEIANQKRSSIEPASHICVVAVSKTKGKNVIIDAYENGCRDFGENYVNELFEKASDPEVLEMCPNIRWHFIGHLQSNKVNKLLGTPNLHMVQTVDSIKLADMLNKGWKGSNPLNVMIQVKTSDEESKSGISPDQADVLFKHIHTLCPNLKCTGLMAIGYAAHDLELGPNPEFKILFECRKNICNSFHEKLELSMGMSQDFEHAVEMGSTCVRVGSILFGARTKKQNN